MMNLGKIVKELRTAKGLSQRQLAQKSGVNHSYISLIEDGQRRKPSLETLEKLLGAMDMELVITFKEKGK